MTSSVCFAAPAYRQLMTTTSINHKPNSLDRKLGGRSLVTCRLSSNNFHTPNLKESLSSHPSRRQRGGLSPVPLDAKIKSSDNHDQEFEDSGALETVLKLYSAIKNRNVRELSDIIDDECQCICNFFSSFQPLQGKKQVLEFFTCLIKFLGDHIEFVVQPTLHDGMVVGIHWRLEWNKANIHLGKGFSFYTCHVYHGRVVIRNVEMFMEPLVQIEPFRLKIIGYLTPIIHDISCGISSKALKRKLLLALLAFLFITIILLFSKLY